MNTNARTAILTALILASCSSKGTGIGPDTTSSGTSGGGSCSDAANCGSDGHSCLGGACSNCQCQAFAFYQDVDTSTWVDHLALDVDALYIGFGIFDQGGASGDCSTHPMIGTLSRGGGGLQTLVPCDRLGAGRQFSQSIKLAAGSIYWAPFLDWSDPSGRPGALERVSILGGKVDVLGGQTYGVNIVADDAFVYAWSFEDGIVRYPLAGGQKEVVLSPARLQALGLDDNFVYWLLPSVCEGGGCDDDAVIGRVPKAGGTAENVLTKVVATDRALWINAGYAYFTQFDSGGAKPSIARVPTSGGAVEIFVEGARAVQMEFDATYASWTGKLKGSNDGLFRVPLAGGPPESLAATDAPGYLVADSKAYFWNDASGNVWLLAK